MLTDYAAKADIDVDIGPGIRTGTPLRQSGCSVHMPLRPLGLSAGPIYAARLTACRARGSVTHVGSAPLSFVLCPHCDLATQPDLFDDSHDTMSQVPSTSTSSPNFETVFTAALKEYEKQTKKDIDSHPLAAELKSCNSPNAVLTVLQTQVNTFDSSEGANERWSKLLDPTVTVLFALSGFISNVTGPVIARHQIPCDILLTLSQILPPAAAIFTGIGALLQVSIFLD